jgi:hypothetical protein
LFFNTLRLLLIGSKQTIPKAHDLPPFCNEAIYALVTAGGMMLRAAVAMLYVNDGKLIRVGR